MPLDETRDLTLADAIRRCMQWTPDGVTWFNDDSVYAMSASGAFKISIGRQYAFYRPTFTNTGASTTTTFFLSTIYDGVRPKPSSSMASRCWAAMQRPCSSTSSLVMRAMVSGA